MIEHPDTGPAEPRRKRPPGASPASLLESAIEAALEEAQRHEEVVVDILVDRLLSSTKLLRAFADCGQLRYAVRRLLGDYLTEERRAIIDGRPPEGVSGEALEGGRAQRIAEGGFLYFPLPIQGNPWIKDATPDQCRKAAEKYIHMGNDYLRKGQFCALVADAKEKRKNVSTELLAELWEKTRAH